MWLPVFAAEAIWKISSDAEAILPCLIESATHTERHRRVLALRTLRAIRPAAKSAVPAIQAAMKIDMKTRHEAVEALKNIEGSNANSSGTTSR